MYYFYPLALIAGFLLWFTIETVDQYSTTKTIESTKAK